MARTVEQYRDQLKSLMPPGRAIPRDPGTTVDDLLHALAEEWARIDARGEALAVDINPASTTELLPDWERVAGLPGECGGDQSATLQGRRADLVERLSSVGGQSAAYFISVAAALGYTVSITEFRPFRAGISCAGDALTNGDWVFTWRVNAPGTTISYFRAGQSTAGERLRTWGNERLECAINRLKPAHTIALFGYSTAIYPLMDYPLDDDGTLSGMYGFAHAATNSPDYLQADYTYTDAAAGGTAVALPDAANWLTSQAITVGAGKILACEAEIVGMSPAAFEFLGIAAAMSTGGVFGGVIVTAGIDDTDGSTPQWNGSGIPGQVRTTAPAGFRVGIELNGNTGAITLRSTDGSQVSSSTFTPGVAFTFYPFIGDSASGTANAGGTVSIRLIPRAADMTLPFTSGAVGPADPV